MGYRERTFQTDRGISILEPVRNFSSWFPFENKAEFGVKHFPGSELSSCIGITDISTSQILPNHVSMSEVPKRSHTGSHCPQGESYAFEPTGSKKDKESYGGA